MNRLKLLLLQILVMVVALAIWHVISNFPIFGDVKTIRFFFSTPIDVLARTCKQLSASR